MYEKVTIYLERLINDAWEVGTLTGGGSMDDYGRMADRAAFEKYEDAEKYAVAFVRKTARAAKKKADEQKAKK
jgi:hypothetical protein